MNLRGIAKAAWILSCGAVLGWWLYSYGFNDELSSTLKAESIILLSLIMIFLTFPSGIFYAVFLSVLGYVLHLLGVNQQQFSLFQEIVIWFGFVIVGYLQWFILLPWLVGKWRARRNKQDVRMASR